MKQIIKDTSITYTTTDSKKLTHPYNLPSFQKRRIIVDPLQFKFGDLVIPSNDLEFHEITSGFDCRFIEINSDEHFYIKLETDTESSIYLQTTQFSYDSKEIPLKISIANGTLTFDPLTNILSQSSGTKNILVNFLTVNYAVTP